MTANLAERRRRSPTRRPLSALAVLGLGYLGTFGPAAANAATPPKDGSPPWASMSVSADATVSTPAASQAPYDARITLDYVITNTGHVPIYRVRLDDALVPGESVSCDGGQIVEVLPTGSSVECEAAVELPPGTYTSGPHARGWVSVLLILGFPVTADAQTTFTVAAPPPPSSPPPSPPASPTPSATARPPAPPATTPSASPAPVPSSAAPVPTRTPAASTSPAAPPSRTPGPAPTPSRPRAVALPPTRPTAQVHQLSAHVAVLLLLLPAAVGAAVAGAAAARRR